MDHQLGGDPRGALELARAPAEGNLRMDIQRGPGDLMKRFRA